MSSCGSSSNPSGSSAAVSGFPSSSSSSLSETSGRSCPAPSLFNRDRELVRGSSSPSIDSSRLQERATRSCPGRGSGEGCRREDASEVVADGAISSRNAGQGCEKLQTCRRRRHLRVLRSYW
jgi:hypothetical protein